MIKLNSDYTNIYYMLKEIEEHFLDCKKPLDSEAYVSIYETLLTVCMDEDKDFSLNTRLYKNKFVNFSSNEKSNMIYKKSMEELIANKDKHSNLILNFIDEISEVIENYLDDNSIELEKNRFSYISPIEQEKILKNYLKNEEREMYELFNYYQKEKRIYKMSKSLAEIIPSVGCTTYNPLDNKSIVFLEEDKNKIGELSTIIHEFGHVLDTLTYSKTHTNNMTSLYFQVSPYIEVNSTYKEYKFYEYLLKNDIYKYDTMAILLDSVSSYLESLSYLAPITFIDPKLLRKNKCILSKEEIAHQVLEKTGVTLDLSECDMFFDMQNSLRYSYGMMIAFSMLDNPQLYDKVQMIRSPYFDKGKLESIGINDESISKVMVKKINNYFKK